jgi:PhnB protein
LKDDEVVRSGWTRKNDRGDENMVSVNPYLNFNGNAEEAFNFYRTVFGGNFTALQRFRDTPDGGKLSAEEQEKIMHISLPIGRNVVLMATDALESMGQRLVVGNNFHLSIDAESKDQAYRLFYELSAGGEVEMPLQTMFWGAFFGMFRDKYGIRWMVSFDQTKK